MKIMHDRLTRKADIVESYIAPEDFTLGSARVKKGSWVMVTKIKDDALWQKILDGKYTGYSFGGQSRTRRGSPPAA